MKLKLIYFLLYLFSSNLYATRPVFEKIDRMRLISQSNFIFLGWPSTVEPVKKCSQEFKRWQVHKVYKGDKGFEGKIISVALHNYKFNFKGAPSYRAYMYEEGTLSLEQGSSILYSNENPDGCFELSAQGAQDHSFKEPYLDALFSDEKDCSAQRRGLEYLVDKLPTNCQSDNDCEVYLGHPRSCSQIYYFNSSYHKQIDDEFKYMERRAQKACEQEFTYFTNCKKEEVPFHCFQNKCKAGYSKEAMKVKVKFSSAKVYSSCAPHDGPSTMVFLSTSEKKGPVFSLNWWGKNYSKLQGSNFEFKSENEKEFSQTFCPFPQVCKPVKKSIMTINQDEKGEKKIKYYIETIDQENFEGDLPLKRENKNLTVCG